MLYPIHQTPALYQDGVSNPNDLSAFLNRLAADIAKSVDGVGGGLSQPKFKVKVVGQGLEVNPLLDTRQTGTAARSATAHFPRRVSDNHLINTAAHQLITSTFDIWYIDPAVVVPTQTWSIDLAVASQPTLVVGEEVMYVQAAASGQSVRFYNEGGAGIAIFPAAYTNQKSNSPLWVRFRFDGTGWVKRRASNDVTI